MIIGIVYVCMLVCLSVWGQDAASMERLEAIHQEGRQETTLCKYSTVASVNQTSQTIVNS